MGETRLFLAGVLLLVGVFSVAGAITTLGTGTSLTATLEAGELPGPLAPAGTPIYGFGDAGFIDIVISGSVISFYLQSTLRQSIGQIEINLGPINTPANLATPSPIQIVLDTDGSTSGAVNLTSRGTAEVAKLKALSANFTNYHVLVRAYNAVRSLGTPLLRGQLVSQKKLYSYIEANVVSYTVPADTGDGFLDLTFNGDPISGPYSVTWKYTSDPLNAGGGGNITKIHIHYGYPVGNTYGQPSGHPITGPLLLTLFLSTTGQLSPGDTGTTLTNTVSNLPASVVNQIRANPFSCYSNVHTTAFPGGEQRGQVESRVSIQTTIANPAKGISIPATIVLGGGGATWLLGDLPTNFGIIKNLEIHFGTAPISAGGTGGPLSLALSTTTTGISTSGSVEVTNQDLISTIVFTPPNYYLRLTSSIGQLADGQLDFTHHTLHDYPIVIETAIGT